MSYQVGSSCFATVVDAGAAACTAFVPVSQFIDNGAAVRTVSCGSSDAQSGALKLTISTAPIDGTPGTVATVVQQQAYPNCTQQDYVDAGLSITGAVLALIGTCFPLWALHRWLTAQTRAEMQ